VIVADANLIAYLLIRGPQTPAAEQAFERDPTWVSPAFWKSEFLNVLAMSVQTGRLDERQARAIWRRALATVVTQESPDGPLVLRFAIRRAISAYDAHYVVLARMLKSRVITGDKQLVRRCPDLAVLLNHFATQA
jgi:predicted nucleic acid-binding protein